ncbi:MAG: SsrA-binding protein [Deltaproteobacteria bacterium CG11_big_fil_rev_8_21_14_0_20_47_16]|nr:MAG: SsrA-binding protein [Deltaproteobacteria bacterium CG11_big_fil_rev_8_21_14_0_20_47_16]
MAEKIISLNRKAGFNFHLSDKFEAGLVLMGSEVKSLRDGKANLGDAYGMLHKGELWLVNCHIGEYKAASYTGHEPMRMRKLLVHKRELQRLIGQLQQKGLSLVPTKMYFKNGRVKIEMALGAGKKTHDKRDDIKKRETNREMARVVRKRG